ncbi:MAG: hypothetical protein MRY78_19335, partial [Saprospiraceae bacterium]|nr:hypothetical protein [Saprospiraceae bacterium]
TTTRLREYTGIYNIPRGFGKPIKVELVGEELVLIMNGQSEKLKEKAKDVFSFVSQSGHEVEFKRSRAAYIRSIWIKRERVIGAVKE